MRTDKQCEKVIEFLKTHESITQRDADYLGIKRLASRIWDIRHKLNVPIEREMIEVRNADLTYSRVARYSLGKEAKTTDTACSLAIRNFPASERPATDAPSGMKQTMIPKTSDAAEKTCNTSRSGMTFKDIADLIKRVNSGTQEQKDGSILFLNFFDWLEIRDKCVKGVFENDLFCGIEYRPRTDCPKGKQYIIERKYINKKETETK